MNLQFRELAALYCFFYYDSVENQSKYPIKFAGFKEEVAKAFLEESFKYAEDMLKVQEDLPSHQL